MCHAEPMTITSTAGGRVPEFTLGWRMRLALETSDIDVGDIANRLSYSRSSISRWLNGHDEPRGLVLDAWARETGVDRDWLETGEGGPGGPSGPGGGLPEDEKVAALTRLSARKRSRHAVEAVNDAYPEAA